MSTILNAGSIYDKVINEEWFSTPDMGEYQSNRTYLESIKGLSPEDVEGDGNHFYAETPPTLEAGYHSDLEVVAIKLNANGLYDKLITTENNYNETDYNRYDGDTLYIPMEYVEKTTSSFQLYYSDKVFNGVEDYIKESMKIPNSNSVPSFGIRFVGIDTPEIVHYNNYTCSLLEDDVYEVKFNELSNNTAFVQAKHVKTGFYSEESFSQFSFRKYRESESDSTVFVERDPNETVTFIKFTFNKEMYPNYASNERIEFHECVTDSIGEEEINDNGKISNKLIKKLVTTAPVNESLDYYNQSKKAQTIVKDAFAKAEDCIVLLDTVGSNNKKKSLPEEYLKSYEKSTKSPFHALYDMWNSLTNKKVPAYKYAGYRIPGQEANGRFLAAVYIKMKHNGKSIWINLNKKVLYECSLATLAKYSNSVDDLANYNYVAEGFKLWTYRHKNQIYIDHINKATAETRDDRYKIQAEIAGCNLEEMKNHTAMIGDTLFMIPPTSIKVVNQSKTVKSHLLRSKGSINKTLPKTERIIQFDLFFNEESGINGVPYDQKLPNGQTKRYYMNGLRSLIAQFKLTPFLPVHNDYINKTLGIDAVSLVSYSINTVPNYPRTLQVTIMMYEFDWVQYLPCQAVPNTDEGLYNNGFSDTIYFPLLRWHYQKALARGSELQSIDLEDMGSSHPLYVAATLGNITALQPMDFKDPTIEFFVPDESLLDYQKQLKIQMARTPLGTNYNFSETQKAFIQKLYVVDKIRRDILKEIAQPLEAISNPSNNNTVVLKGFKNGTNYSYVSSATLPYHINSDGEVILSEKDVFNYYIEPSYQIALKTFNDNRSALSNVLSGIDMRTKIITDSNSSNFNISLVLKLNENYFESESELDLIRQFCSKQKGLTKDNIFKDFEISIDNFIQFEPQMENIPSKMKKPLSSLSNDSISALEFLASLGAKDLDEDFDITDIVEDTKESIDTEDENSIKFFHYDIGEGEGIEEPPIITNMVCTYNNIFSNVGLKAVDGHAAQYTGGSDSTIEIEMIGNEYTAGQIQLLNRVCMDYLIRYRRILKASPLRINSDLTRMLGIYEVIIDNVSIDTIPETPGKFKINLRLSSADRTIRNKENLTKIKGVDNSSVERNEIINTKNYFDLKSALGKAELYPDLELPTVKELEEAGFYFIKNKYQPERVYTDPDFYFIYWYPSFAETLRTTISEYFSGETDLNYVLEDNLFNDVFNLRLNVGSQEEHGTLYDVLNWNEANQSYDEFVNKVKNLVESVEETKESKERLTAEEMESFTDYTTNQLSKFNKLQSVSNTLQEAIDSGTENVYQANANAIVTVKDIDILDPSDSINKEILERSSSTQDIIIEALSLKIKDTEWNDLDAEISANIWDGSFLISRIKNKESWLTKILQSLVKSDNVNASNKMDYIGHVVKAAAVGAMARQGLYGVNSKGFKDHGSLNTTNENLYYPPRTVEITNAEGKKEEVPICLYQGENELLIAHDEKTRNNGIIFGRYGIRKYSADELSAIFNRTFKKAGFLDPYYNAELYEIMIGSKEGAADKTLDSKEELERINEYINGLLYNDSFIMEAHLRQMWVWLYVLLKDRSILNTAFLNATSLLKVTEFKASEAEEILKFLTGEELETEEEISSTTGKTSTSSNEKLYNKLISSAKEEMKDASETQEDMLKNQLESLKSNSKDYVESLFSGLMQTLSAIAMSGLDSYVLKSVSSGNLEEYSNFLSSSESVVDMSELAEEEQRMARFVQYCNDFVIDEDKQFERNPIVQSTYNNRIQRAYLKAANDPKTYMLHSYYDMVIHDKRGTMARAFPAYYMLLIDEGRQIGLWRLQDNFYDMNSIMEFEVVKSRKIAADTARIVMSNLYGIFTSDDEDMKDENVYTMRDVWDSIWSPQKYYKKEYVRRSNAREINKAKMQPGARVHLRMGYSSNAADLPIIFNGCVTEFEAGETMTLICQGDGVEIANPHMFNAIDGKDVEDIQHSDKFFGYKQVMETWDNLSTPRDLLTLPLAAEGTWSQEFIRKISNGRFFNSNPFGIVHFGDRKFQTIFTTNGEVEQNIYESVNKPSFNYEKSGIITVDDGIEKEYRMDEAPKVKVKMESGISYWDIMHIASSLSPDFVCAIAPFQLRSTVFHGHPRFYYAYDYIMLNSKIIEKRKPFQQYHIYTSYSDIIDNKIATSSQDVRTNAIGYYTGPSWLSKKTETVGPLFVDIDIFPEYQKSTSFNLNFEYKNSDKSPFNVPIFSKGIDMLNLKKGPNGYQTAWRATANGLKDCIKDMYKGELIVLGDPTVKPFDRMMISDMYEDMSGTCEVESVVHMFSTETGFTTSIIPDCISAIDNKYETLNAAINQQVFLPATLSSTMLALANISFIKKNRTAYLAASRIATGAGNIASKTLDTVMTIVGKEAAARDAMAIGSAMPKSISDILHIDSTDIKLYDLIKDITNSTKSFNNISITNGTSFIKALDNIDELGDIITAAGTDNINTIKELLGSDRYAKTDAYKMLGNISDDLISGLSKTKNAFILDTATLKELGQSISKIENKTDDIVKLADMVNDLVSSNKTVNLVEDKDLLKSLKALSNVDDFSSTGILKGFTGFLQGALKNTDEGLAIFSKLDDIVKAAINGAKGFGLATLAGAKSLLLNNLLAWAVQVIAVKGAQEFLTRKLRNMQVLTIYPLMKDNMVWTAGLNGNQGSVYGSLAYDEPGWLEQLAISFFDYGSDAKFWSGAKFLAIMRDMFITTDEMREIVDGYKRGNNYSEDHQSAEKIRQEQMNDMLSTVAQSNLQGYTDYKKVYLTSRLKASEIKDNTDEAKLTYAKYKMPYITNIETTKEISLKLENIITADMQQLNKTLYEKGLLKLAYDENVESEYFKLTTKSIMIDETRSELVKIKELTGDNAGVYDIPYLRKDACMLFNEVVLKTLKHIQPDYSSPNCEFENLKKHPIILHSATRINSNKGWRSTGFLFTIEVKNYDKVSNIIKELESERDELTKTVEGSTPFSIQYESTSEFGVNAISFFLHCPKEEE